MNVKVYPVLELLVAEALSCPACHMLDTTSATRRVGRGGGGGPSVSLTALLPQGQLVPGRAGAPYLHGASVPEGEQGAQAGREGTALRPCTRGG